MTAAADTERVRTASPAWITVIDVPWYPMLFAAAWVLNLWVETGVSLLAIVRSLAIVEAGVGLLLLIAILASRRPHLAGVISVAAFGLLVSRNPSQALSIAALTVVVPLAVWQWARIRHRAFSWPRLTRALNLLCSLILLLVLFGGIGRGTLAAVPVDLSQRSPTAASGVASVGATEESPDIFILLLDGYPRADWYGHIFDGDNAAFLGELEARGFSVAGESTSNYMFTQLTLASMFHMRPVPEIPELVPVLNGAAPGHPRLRNTINDNPVFDALREHGYGIVTYGPGYEHVALRQADVYLDGGQLNDFEYELLRSTTIERIVLGIDPGFMAAQVRDRTRDGLDAFATVTAEDGGPTFAFVHLPVPHLPVVFAADGGAAPLPPSGHIYGEADEDQLPAAAYRSQLEFLNRRVLELVDGLESRPGEEPIVIIMSDHGAERRPQVFESDGNAGHYANLFAARTPGATDVFPADHSPINTFPRLFNAYFGMELGEWPDERYPWIASP
jgi:hypothetical protein